MSRLSTGDVIVQKPGNNVYTAIAGAGFVLVLIGLILFYLKADAVLGAGNLLK
ncbi:MAG: hypothetical protein H7144_16790 [Burkholderiales bacterium]|nr:hypothetical protein [Phycisphaerae bacterium]